MFALSFSNAQPFTDPSFENSLSMFIATGSYMPGENKLEIVRMNESSLTMNRVLSISEPYPASKLQWIPSGAFGAQSTQRDILATCSDILRIYDVKRDDSDSDRPMKLSQTIKMRNEKEFMHHPISSFDWNRHDPTKIAIASLD